MRSLPVRYLALLGVLVLLVISCGAPQPGAPAGGAPAAPSATPRAGGDIVVTILEDADKLDPTFGATAGGREIFANMCERLYDLNAKGELVPQLATALPQFSADGKTLTIPLRKDVLFNDGTPFNADAVKTSLERHKNAKGSRRAGELTTLEQVTVVDPTTVRLTLTAPTASLVAALSDRSGMIMSPAQLQKLGDNFGDSPVCVGPFSLVERVVADRIVLGKSKHYYDKDKVFLDKITFKPINDANVKTTNLRSGDLHVVDRVPGTDVKTLQSDSKFTVLKVVTYGILMLQLNVANENGIGTPPGKPNSPFTNLLVRQAFELSLDRDQLNNVAFNGLHLPGCTPLPPNSPFAPTVTCSKRDVAKAKDLIRQAGVPTPIKVDMLVLNQTEPQRLGEAIQAQAKEAGFDVVVRPTEATVAQDSGRKGQFNVSYGVWSGRVDPDLNIWQFQHTMGADNQSNVSDPKIDSLLDKARTEVNIDARKKLYADAIGAILARNNTIYLGYQVVYAAFPKTVQGFEMYADGMPRLKNAFFTAGR